MLALRRARPGSECPAQAGAAAVVAVGRALGWRPTVIALIEAQGEAEVPQELALDPRAELQARTAPVLEARVGVQADVDVHLGEVVREPVEGEREGGLRVGRGVTFQRPLAVD